MYHGQIFAPIEDKNELEGLGVKLGQFSVNDNTPTWSDCCVTEDGLEKLQRHWLRWIWTLKKMIIGKLNQGNLILDVDSAQRLRDELSVQIDEVKDHQSSHEIIIILQESQDILKLRITA
ncbi:MAG: hypothetical protein Q7R33_01690 [Nitrosarchaeum sp.]|nr:hypothetical protein [Nitrosarchaeum sp.]